MRTSDEFLERHIENSINVDYNSNTFKIELNELDTSKKYFILFLTFPPHNFKSTYHKILFPASSPDLEL